jgi:glycosyltransferase involved in cell wall biosynthesis
LVVFGGAQRNGKTRQAGLPIEFRGVQPRSDFLDQLAAEIDIWVHPSRIEAHSLTICEAIQAGCPVIAGRASGGVPWTLEYGRAGVLVDVENPSEIAEAMVALVNHRERALDLVSYGRRMIRDQLSPDRVARMHLDYYEDLMDRG